MGRVKEFVIKTNEDPTCVTPDADGCLKVSGSLVVSLAVEVEVDYLTLSFKGESHCSWTEGSGKDSTSESSMDCLFEEQQTLITHGSTPTTLTSGTHVYPFIFLVRINRHIPSSCVGTLYGSITYQLFAKMDRVGIIFDDRTTQPITVNNPMVLNMSQYLTPVSFDKEHTDCCLCCASGPAIVEATINRTALTLQSSDRINMTLTIDNLMGKSLIPKVYLMEVKIFHAGGSTKYCFKKLCQAEGQVLRPNTRKNLVQLQLGPVIADVIGTVQSVSNIFVEYRVLVKLKGSRFRMDYPIMMGLDSAAVSTATLYQVYDEYARGPDRPALYSFVHFA